MAAMAEDMMAAMEVVMAAAMAVDTEALTMTTMEDITTLIYSTQKNSMGSNVSYFAFSTNYHFVYLDYFCIHSSERIQKIIQD